MKKGFTLIELLAVIVILAIIALIATPIILGIINDAREESNERSVELYASAVRNGIAAHQLTEGSVAAGTYTKETLPFDVDVDGKVVCDTIKIYKDGSIYVADCTVNGAAVDYTYGINKYEPQYYGFLSGTINSTMAPAEPSTVPPTGRNIYLGYDVAAGKVSTGYVCFKRNGIEHCLKGTDAEAYATNKTVLEDVFKDVESACSLTTGYFYCSADSLYAIAHSTGNVVADDGDAECYVYDDGRFDCDEL